MLTVTGYWNLNGKCRAKANHSIYLKRMKKATNLNSDYIVFGDKETIDYVKSIRKGKVTHSIEMSLTQLIELAEKEFKTKNIITNLSNTSIHPIHSPTPELLLVWLSKVILLKKAIEHHPEYTHYGWLDAGTRMRKTPTQPFPTDNLQLVKGLYIKRAKSAGHSNLWNIEYETNAPIGTQFFGDRQTIKEFIVNCYIIIIHRLENGLCLTTEQDVYHFAVDCLLEVSETRDNNNYKLFFLSDF